jgi:hypothetical protein
MVLGVRWPKSDVFAIEDCYDEDGDDRHYNEARHSKRWTIHNFSRLGYRQLILGAVG